MSKYDPLSRYLAGLESNSVTVSFEKINALVTGGLPSSAYEYRPWWANRHDGNDAQNKGWQSVGWESSDVDMQREQVTFNRVAKLRADSKETPYIKHLSLDEAKLGLAAKFGITPDQIDINIRG